ncbi:MAG: protein-glutamate O-methyltransferase CheR [Gammaproteobacteria bacterium]|nr:protein-glutamate O-methyltransferase CheR [Gammaproteobacteria bacterium]MDH5802338.1 protein-glutamate O-methyltransferase CheR [Gammaproteobacteria bacterium]
MTTSDSNSYTAHPMNEKEYCFFKEFIGKQVGIALAENKQAMVSGRLNKRLNQLQMNSYSDYIKYLKQGHASEEQVVIDLLTTNETCFFREPKHFEVLETSVLPGLKRHPRVRVWSAACSSGEEAYSLAMLLDSVFNDTRWEILASDVSRQMLETAERGLYPLDNNQRIPKHYLQRYCLKGVRSQSGQLLMDKDRLSNMTFRTINLTKPLPDIGKFHIIFLRNVLIYFAEETRVRVIHQLEKHLIEGGYFVVGHSESLHGISKSLKPLIPSIYQNGRGY